VAGPLIPYIPGNEWEIPLAFLHPKASIKPFGTLVAIGVWVGVSITVKRARERRLDLKPMNDFIFWVVATGFVLSHMLDAIAYHPDQVKRDPWYLLKIWDGLSSYGGFMGAVIGAFAWRFYRRRPVLEYIDLCVSAFPTAWIFGRMGCSIVHDHPGALSNAWFAVRYPPRLLAEGFEGRFDLGLYEMLLTLPLAYACHQLWKARPLRAHGFYVGVTLTAYAPVRFLLDFLRVGPEERVVGSDPRYLGLTPAQWACFLALAVGLYFLRKTWSAPYEQQAEPEARGSETARDADADEEAKEAGERDGPRAAS
jgi:phosphatidylglycerol:prolipoprotein diacylglycerol transferase